jgi:hypothetical protein
MKIECYGAESMSSIGPKRTKLDFGLGWFVRL